MPITAHNLRPMQPTAQRIIRVLHNGRDGPGALPYAAPTTRR